MDFILVLVAILLASASLGLWNLSKHQTSDLVMGALLSPEPEVALFPLPKPRVRRYQHETIEHLIFVILGLLLSITVIVYLVLAGQSWIALLLALVPALLLVYIIFGLFLFQEVRYEAELHEDVSRRIAFFGEVTLPKRVYEGDSQNISADLRPRFSPKEMREEALFIQDTKSGKSVLLQFSQDKVHDEFLEIELLAAGLTVDGKKKQRQSLASRVLSYRWNCYFANSGKQTLAFVLRMVCASSPIELGTIEHTVQVVQFDNLTKRHVWILASFAGIASGAIAIAEIMHRLGVW